MFLELAKEGIDQEIFIPIKNKDLHGINQFTSEISEVNFYYTNILKKPDRLLFYRKTWKQLKEVEKLISVDDEIDFIHAHTIFSDGATAYYLHKKYGIKYIVNVRNTDINVFWKLGIHLRKLMYNILINAEKIVFLSPSYKDFTLNKLPTKVSRQIREKSIIIPNGINKYWHNVRVPEKKQLNRDNLNLIYVGMLDKNKNVEVVIRTLANIKKNNNITLRVVGDGEEKKNLIHIVNKLDLNENVKFYGYLKKEEITELMDESDIFIMTSFKETFGLVYIEAMSRGLPVIYTMGQGIDGYFEKDIIGVSVDPSSSECIENAIFKVLENYNTMSSNCTTEAKKFKWEFIGSKYLEVYNKGKVQE